MRRLLDDLPGLRSFIEKMDRAAARDAQFKARFLNGEVDADGEPISNNPQAVEQIKRAILATRRNTYFGVQTGARTLSHLGGSPDLPLDLAWPTHENRPLTFIAQVDLAAISPSGDLAWLPQRGKLLFFAGQNEVDEYDPMISRVLYVPQPEADWTETSNCQLQAHFTFEPGDSYTPLGPDDDAGQADDNREIDRWYYELMPPQHYVAAWQIGGWPRSLGQLDMQAACEQRFRQLDWNDFAAFNTADFQLAKQTWCLVGQFDLESVVERPNGFHRGFFWVKVANGRALFDKAVLIGQSD